MNLLRHIWIINVIKMINKRTEAKLYNPKALNELDKSDLYLKTNYGNKI
jgi:hypothetical protein